MRANSVAAGEAGPPGQAFAGATPAEVDDERSRAPLASPTGLEIWKALTGAPWTPGTVRRAAEVMAREGTPIDDHRASAAYRTAMLRQALLRLHAQHPALQEVTS